MKLSKASLNSSVAVSAVMTSTLSGSRASMSSLTASKEAPDEARTAIWVNSPGKPSTSAAAAVSNNENTAPAPALSG